MRFIKFTTALALLHLCAISHALYLSVEIDIEDGTVDEPWTDTRVALSLPTTSAILELACGRASCRKHCRSQHCRRSLCEDGKCICDECPPPDLTPPLPPPCNPANCQRQCFSRRCKQGVCNGNNCQCSLCPPDELLPPPPPSCNPANCQKQCYARRCKGGVCNDNNCICSLCPPQFGDPPPPSSCDPTECAKSCPGCESATCDDFGVCECLGCPNSASLPGLLPQFDLLPAPALSCDQGECRETCYLQGCRDAYCSGDNCRCSNCVDRSPPPRCDPTGCNNGCKAQNCQGKCYGDNCVCNSCGRPPLSVNPQLGLQQAL